MLQLQWWPAVGNTVSDIQGLNLKPPAPETNAFCGRALTRINGIVEKDLGHLFFPQVIFISSIKPILSSISLSYSTPAIKNNSFLRKKAFVQPFPRQKRFSKCNNNKIIDNNLTVMFLTFAGRGFLCLIVCMLLA